MAEKNDINDMMDRITKLEIEIYKLEMKRKNNNKIDLNVLIDNRILKKYGV